MKIKILKIKVENENQDFDFKDFFVGSNTLYNTTANIVKEDDGLYWHAFITYEPQNNYLSASIPRQEKKLPEGFEEEIRAYLKKEPPKKTRSKNAVLSNIENILNIKETKEFARLRNITEKNVFEDVDFFTAVLEIIKKHQPKE